MTEPTWHLSTYSEDGSACVEIAPTPTAIHIRDSKTPTSLHLTLQPSAWAEFVAHAVDTRPPG